jgi:diacylglycerol kinase (ATP)
VSLNDRLQSFRFAARGLSWLIRSQPNARLHAAAAAAAVAAGFFLRIERLEWVAVALAIAAVVAAEAMNSAIEEICDVVSPEFHPGVERAKNVAAGGVLIAALGAVAVGVLVFGPRLLEFL